MARVNRGRCNQCGKNTVERVGEAIDGRPVYQCQDDRCRNSYTKGLKGEDWDNDR